MTEKGAKKFNWNTSAGRKKISESGCFQPPADTGSSFRSRPLDTVSMSYS